ncbi:MAG: hypothetical protein K1X75_14705 [Leptospirales bacterium]|nr:hypothetical protein [Leptospirales bacterium]
MVAWTIGNDVYARTYAPTRGWSAPQVIDNLAVPPALPTACVSQGGQGAVVWVQSDGAFNSIYVARYHPLSGWSSAQQVDGLASIAQNPNIGCDASGRALVIYRDTANNYYYVYYSSGQWSTQTLFDTVVGATVPMGLDMSADGYATVVLTPAAAPRGFSFSPWTRQFTPVQSIGSSSAIYGTVAAGGGGTATAVWANNLGGPDMYSNQLGPAGWQTEFQIKTFGSEPSVSIDSSGVYTAAFVDANAYDRIWAAQLRNGVWSAPQQISPVLSVAGTLTTRVAGGAAPAVVWLQTTGGLDHVFAARYLNGWQPAQQLENDVLGAVGTRAAADGLGRAVAIWLQSAAGQQSVWYSESGSSGGWTPAALLEEDNSASVIDVSVDFY